MGRTQEVQGPPPLSYPIARGPGRPRITIAFFHAELGPNGDSGSSRQEVERRANRRSTREGGWLV
jgi:hypothetical protein